MDIIRAETLVKRYRTGRGIEGISLSVRQGQCFGVLGANGSGKTTLTRLVAGLDRIEQGRLDVLGHRASPRPLHLRRRCGIALDTPAQWDNLTGRQNLSFFAQQYGLRGSTLTARTNQLLAEADLATQADEPVSGYSFGMRRKLSILEALAHNPDLLILDEPSAGVDVAFQDRLAEWIRQRSQDGKTTWIADNDADWLARTATNVVLLSQGRIAAGGCVRDLMDSIDARCRITVSLTEPAALGTPPWPGIKQFHCDGSAVRADADGDPHLPAELLGWITAAGGQVRSMEVRSITLHEALEQAAAVKEPAV